MRSAWTYLLLVLTLLCGSLLYAQSTAPCTYTLFRYPGTQTIQTWANGVNRYNTVVGAAQDQTSGVFGFIRYSNGSFKRYSVSGSGNTQFFHRNENGATVGFYQSASTQRKHGLLLSGSTLTTIDYPGATDTVLTGINKYGTTVGYYTDSTHHLKGFKRWSNGGLSSVSIPGYSDIMPMDINDSGVITGTLGMGGPVGIHGFTYFQGNWQILDDPDYPPSTTGMNGISNGAGEVGQAFDNNGTGHAIWLLGNSSYFDLVVPNGIESFAGGIFHGTTTNVIVGGVTVPGASEGFIAQCQ